jgi:hypothetical protein
VNSVSQEWKYRPSLQQAITILDTSLMLLVKTAMQVLGTAFRFTRHKLDGVRKTYNKPMIPQRVNTSARIMRDRFSPAFGPSSRMVRQFRCSITTVSALIKLWIKYWVLGDIAPLTLDDD